MKNAWTKVLQKPMDKITLREVNKTIPIPAGRRSVEESVPLWRMEVGDSVVVDVSRSMISKAMKIYKYKNPNADFTTRVVLGGDGKKYIRIWRMM